MQRTEQIWLKPSTELSRLCHISKNLYNEANYIIRQELFETNKWIRYNILASQLKTSENYKILPAQTAQQILKNIDGSWKSYFRAIKGWKKHPNKFQEMPRIPRYKKKDGEHMLIFTNQQAKIRDNILILPGKGDVIGKIKTKIKTLREVRVIPKSVGYMLEIIHNKQMDIPKRDKNRIAGIDYGVRNLVAIVNNIGMQPVVVKGGVAKSMNHYFNKEKARLQHMYDKQDIRYGLKMKRLLVKRDKKMHDYLHKVSRTIIDMLAEDDIGLLVIGHNDNWKQNINIGRRNNQNFVSTPYYKLGHMLKYKGEEQGIEVIFKDEGHTSKCSFFDDEPIRHHSKYVGVRRRGLFWTRQGFVINADVNGGLNIVKKAVSDAFHSVYADGIQDAMGHPLRLAISC